jgi:putative sterol carrier protein
MNGQQAFITGKLKTKGNMILATKLDALLKLKVCISNLADVKSFLMFPSQPSTPKAKL